MAHKRTENFFQIEDLRLSLMQGNHIDTKRGLHLCQQIKVVQYHFTDRIAFDFNHNAHTVFIGFITQCADTFQTFLFNQLGDFLNQRALFT